MKEPLSEYDVAYIIIFLVLVYLLYYGRISFRHKSLPGPWGLPIVGYLPWLGEQPHLTLTKLGKKYGNIFQISLGRKQVVILNDHATIREALVNKSVEFADRPDLFVFNFMRLNGRGVFSSHYGPQFKLRRKIMIQALNKFANRRATNFHKTLEQAVNELVTVLKDTKGEPYNPKEDIKHAVGKIISSLLFGTYFEDYEKDYKAIMRNLSMFNSIANPKSVLNYLPWLKIFFHQQISNFHKFETTFYTMCKEILKPHTQSADPENLRDIADAIVKSSEEIKNSGKVIVTININDIISMTRELLGAGFASVASVLHWGILYITLYPEIQKRVQIEIDSVVQDNSYPSLNDRTKLPFTEATILETLRFASILPLGVARATIEDIVFKGYFISKETMVIANFSAAHMDTKVWKDPQIFNPSRFLTEDQSTLENSMVEKIIAFGVGRRRCAGEILAKMELFVLFATMLQQFEFCNVPTKSLDLNNYETGLVLIPNDLTLKIIPRK